MRLNKKGSIEMSMQTIIVIIIGVTLLSLGIKFVVDTMSGASEMGGSMFKKGDTVINDIFGDSDEMLSIMPDTIEVQKGGSPEKATVYIRNTGSDSTVFTIVPTVIEAPDDAAKTAAAKWVILGNKKPTIAGGNMITTTLLLKPTATAKIGTYMVSIGATCANEEICQGETTKEVIIEVTGN